MIETETIHHYLSELESHYKYRIFVKINNYDINLP